MFQDNYFLPRRLFLKTVVTLMSFFSMRAAHHTSLSTKALGEIFVLPQNLFANTSAAPIFFVFVPIAMFKCSISAINPNISHVFIPYEHALVVESITW